MNCSPAKMAIPTMTFRRRSNFPLLAMSCLVGGIVQGELSRLPFPLLNWLAIGSPINVRATGVADLGALRKAKVIVLVPGHVTIEKI